MELPSVEYVLLAVAAGLIALNVLVRMLRAVARRPWAIRWAWRRTRPRPLGARDRRRLPSLALDTLARAVAALAHRPLRVQAFEGPPDVDASAVSSALSAAMSRIASARDSGVDAVTAPIEAEATVEAIAAAVKAAPAGGDLATALVRITATLTAPGELQLSGRVLPDNAGGPGLALTLATARGRVRERLTLRADELEPVVGSRGKADGGADRLTRLATAGAVWTHFQILQSEWHVRKRDLERTMRTSSWRSYALMRIGIEGKERHGPHVARALFAKAVDEDSSNLAAQFNLASAELKDGDLEQVRLAAMKRLEDLRRALDPHGGHGSTSIPASRREELLLELDPLCYQVSYKRIAAKLNTDVRLEAEHEERSGQRLPLVPRCASWLPAGSTAELCRHPLRYVERTLTAKDLAELTEHLGKLESTLAVLKQRDGGRWRMAGSKPWKQRAGVLREIEGPLLALWAMVALRVGDRAGNLWTPEALWTPEDSSPGPARSEARRRLVELLEQGALTPAFAVACARGADVRRSSRTRFNLACWYADIGRLDDALRELALSLECGGILARRRLHDSQLRHLHGEPEWKELELRYDPPSQSVPELQQLDGRPPGTVQITVG